MSGGTIPLDTLPKVVNADEKSLTMLAMSQVVSAILCRQREGAQSNHRELASAGPQESPDGPGIAALLRECRA